MSEQRQLINNAGVDAPESCGVCGDTGLVDHDDGDAYGCNYCGVGSQKISRLFLQHSYAVNDITAAVRKPGLKLGLPEYAQTPAGRRDPHLDKARQMVMAARREKKEQQHVGRDHPTARHLPALPGRGADTQRVLGDGQVDAGAAAPVDGE